MAVPSLTSLTILSLASKNFVASGSGAAANVGSLLEANGDIVLGTGSTATGWVQIKNTGGLTVGSGEIEIEFYMKLNNLSGATQRYEIYVGLGNDTFSSSEFTDGCYFKYSDNINSGNFQVVCANGGVRTINNTTVAPATSYDVYRIVVNADGTSVSFYKNGVEVAGSPIATNIPTTVYPIFKIVKSVGTTSRSISLDYCKLIQTLTTPRS